ncbi:MAG: PQQ-binding-like beta-propeller repeat protein [Phycisphaeraceae bacterium]|nr:PQQ-binding-like beta-propeller repeat protein [Phycisphaeraceae bacterium]MCB9847466.1 PQQ-binding-like beta-propeller repeat protein [Phycisphaeraceae bacterium]
MNRNHRRCVVTFALLGSALALCLSGCAGSSSSREQSRAETPRQKALDRAVVEQSRSDARKQEHDAVERLGYRIAWRGFPFFGSDLKVRFAELLGDSIAVLDDSNTVTVMDPVTGRNRWSTRLAGDLTRFVGIARHEGTLLCASDTTLYVLDIRTGTIKDKQRLAVVVNTAPVIIGHMAIFGCTSGELLGHNLETGYKQWGYLLNGSITSEPVPAGVGVAAVSQGGDVLIVNPGTGASYGRALIFDGLSNNPVAGADTLFVASRDQSVYAFEASTGRRIWRYRSQRPITDQPAAHDGRLYVAIPGEGLVAFNGATGDVIWTAPDVRGEPIGVHKGRLIVWNGADATVVDDQRGDVIETVHIPGLKALKMTSFVDGDLYAVTPDGAVARYTPEN